MSRKLKPCPFCGGDGEIVGAKWHPFVTCSSGICSLGNIAYTVKEWNTRPIEDRLTAEVARLRGLVRDGIEAFRHTREYVGEHRLPEVHGWSWYDWTIAAKVTLEGGSDE